MSSGSPEFSPHSAVADAWDPWPTYRSLALRAGALHRVHLARVGADLKWIFRK